MRQRQQWFSLKRKFNFLPSAERSSYGQVQFGISMTTRGKTTGKSERLSVLNNAEQEALYGGVFDFASNVNN